MGSEPLVSTGNSTVADEKKTAVLELVKIITNLLCNAQINDTVISSDIKDSAEFQKLYNTIMDVRTLSSSLNKGELDKLVYNKGFILANMKALQSNLRHLTWQTKKIAEGDFSQKVDFLGDFSESFNKMTDKLRENSQRLTKLATFDPLTQIPNRRSLDDFLERTFETCDKFCVFFIDIDFFKKVNDTYGHDAGDLVLVHLSDILKKQFRTTDFVGRYGGEEFVAILPDATLDIASNISERLLRTVESTPATTTKTVINLTISIGISSRLPEDSSYHDVLKRGDQALYAAKNGGRNRYCLA
jgi:diguanylate cyclase (GGDEF)-like protein